MEINTTMYFTMLHLTSDRYDKKNIKIKTQVQLGLEDLILLL